MGIRDRSRMVFGGTGVKVWIYKVDMTNKGLAIQQANAPKRNNERSDRPRRGPAPAEASAPAAEKVEA